MVEAPFYGTGFALLPLRPPLLEGKLAHWRDGDLAVLVALAAHSNAEGSAWPSQMRLATLAGCSKTTVQLAVENLAVSGWVTVKERGRGRRYEMPVWEDATCIAVRQAVVFSGLWAGSTPAARKLYLLLQALSRPGAGEDGRHIRDWEEAVKNAAGKEGTRHVIPEDIQPARLAKLIGVADRTYREAWNRLVELDLIVEYESSDVLLLPNDPGCFMPSVLDALRQREESSLTPSAKRAAAWRQRRKAQPAGSVPRRGTKRLPPDQAWMHPSEFGQPHTSLSADGSPTIGGICTGNRRMEAMQPAESVPKLSIELSLNHSLIILEPFSPSASLAGAGDDELITPTKTKNKNQDFPTGIQPSLFG